MAVGTLFVVVRGFTSVIGVGTVLIYVALVALVVNLGVAATATVFLDRRGVPRERAVVVA